MTRRALVAVMTATLGGALPLPPAHAAVSQDQTLYVELIVNGVARAGLVELRADGTRLTMAAAALRDAGIGVEGEADIDLAGAGFAPVYDAPSQTLNLTLPATMLPVTRRSGTPRERVLAEAATGVAINYDAYVQHRSGRTSASLWSEQRLFGAFGSLSNTGVARVGSDERGYLRYDTRLRRIDADRALALTAGDLITGALSWTRPVRLGGVQIGRNFRARPDLVTMPLPSFAGEAAVPSAVDLFIDGYRQQRETVDPGRFVIEDMPQVSGGGIATIVTTDAVGRQVSTSVPFYVAPELLRAGLSDFSVEAGLVRKDYGLRSFAYGQAAASAYLRHGLSNRTTVELHGEWSEQSAALGVGAVWLPGLFGTVSGNVVVARADGQTGTQLTAGYQFTGRRFSIAAEHRRRSATFRTLADFDQDGVSTAGSSTRAVASVNLDSLGSIGAGYLDLKPLRGPRGRLATASWSLPLTRSIAAFLSVDHDFDRGTASGQLRIAFPLGGGSASTGLGRDRARGWTAQGEYSRAAPLAGGIGVNAGAAIDEHGRAYAQGEGTLRTAAAQLIAGASVADRRAAVWGGAAGSIIALDGSLFVANDVDDAFAVVSTDGVAGVPVYYENQLIGKTNRKGHVLVTGVTAYQPASVTLDPMRLDAGLMPGSVTRRFAVAEGAATVLAMPIRRLRSATIALVDADDVAIAAGSIATLADGTRVTIGWDGIVYVEDIAQARAIEVVQPTGARCRAAVADLDGAVSLDRREGVRCL